jgi:hypothetical protein
LYTMAVSGAANPTNAPGGDSYGFVSVSSSGIAKVSGKLSDGTSFSQSAGISKYGNWPFYVSLLSGQGSVSGWLIFTNLSDSSLEGHVSWIKPPTLSRYYPQGFTNVGGVAGSTYIAPLLPQEQRVIQTTNNIFSIYGGNESGLNFSLSVLTANNLVGVDNNVVLYLAAPSKGYMTWLLLNPPADFRKAFQGVALQQQREARGFFLGTNLSGAFLLQPND